MISFDEAVELVGSVARPLGAETVPIAEAAGRVLASPVVAAIDSPRSDVSAMDGYAVREADLGEFPVSLRVIGESFPGKRWNGAVEGGECVRIFTGAALPAGADRIIIQEHVRRDDGSAMIDAAPGADRHVRRHGSDFATGDELLPTGRLLDPQALVATAAADVARVEVFRRPRLAILSTGDELAEPGSAQARTDAIPDSVSFGSAALAAQWGAECVSRTRLGDDLPTLREAAGAAVQDADVVVVTGGASVGERDFAKPMFEPAGLELIFSKVSIKPGKPVWLGRAGNVLVLGLPGNPTSALVTARLLLAPLLAGLGGRDPADALHWRSATLASPIEACGDRETFHRARWSSGRVEILRFQDSSAQKALAEAELLVRRRAHAKALATGDAVEVIDF